MNVYQLLIIAQALASKPAPRVDVKYLHHLRRVAQALFFMIGGRTCRVYGCALRYLLARLGSSSLRVAVFSWFAHLVFIRMT